MSILRRFYFDDGTSRKRWHVTLNAKSQVVEYGRLGAALRESKKTFKTPQEAIDGTDKLIAAKKREGYVEIKPESLEITRYKGKKSATVSQISSLEKQLGCRLPDEYRNFLITRNGGRPNPPYVQIPGIEDIDNVGVGDIFGLFGTAKTENSLLWAIPNLGRLLPSGYLPIACDSDLFTLSLRKKDFGCIHFWFHETDQVDDNGRYLEGAPHLLAGSFDEFLTRIAGMFGADEEEESDSAPAGKTANQKPAKKATVRTLFGLLRHDHTPAVIKEVEQVVKQLGDLSGIKDGEWPFNNIRSDRLLRCLLDAGLNPEILDTERQTLLWQCAGSAECVDLLVKRGVDIERRSRLNSRQTALMRALFVKSVPGVKRLLAAGANPTVRLPFHISLEIRRHTELLKLLDFASKKWQLKKARKK